MAQKMMGAIYDRSKEHLGRSDTAIIHMRARLINTARGLREGHTPPGVDDADLYQVRASVAVLPRDVPWLNATEQLRRVIPGTNPGGVQVG